jgi:predicted RNA binding protein YcfA (HicA-like mRNA interferase family)
MSMKVRDVIRRLEQDGWQLVATKGDHRHFRHPHKPGKVTVAGRRNVEVPVGTLASIRKQSGLEDFR